MRLLKRIFERHKLDRVTELVATSDLKMDAADLRWRDDATFPIVDWDAARKRAPTGEDAKALAEYWRSVAVTWLDTLRASLGDQYGVATSESFAILSSLKGKPLQLTIDCCERYRKRILRTLEGVATSWGNGPHVILIFDHIDEYYGYVGNYYPKQGEFAMSSGMFIQHGYGHFVFRSSHMSAMEPIIAHELTHCLLAPLPLPAWLNEGTAVSMEEVLAPSSVDRRRGIFVHKEAAKKRADFWNATTIQEFWSGKSFKRPDEGCSLSYELATELTRLIARDYARYRAYMNMARWNDSGSEAAKAALGISLGDLAAAVLGEGHWNPAPEQWHDGAELGQF